MSKRKVKIPRSFRLMGRKVRVKWNERLDQTFGMYGQAQYGPRRIIMSAGDSTREEQEATFWHEAMHHIFMMVGRTDLKNDETLVEGVSGLIHQLLQTAKYDKR